MNIDTASNPVLRYKLDPGEWGSDSPASAASSISRVSSHESANIQRFEKKANMDGCYVVGKDLRLNLNREGDFLAATSGHSSVETYCPKKQQDEQIKVKIGSSINAKLEKYSLDKLRIETMLKSSENSTQKEIYKSKLKDIDNKKLTLQQKKFRIYTEITLLFVQNLSVRPSLINLSV